MSFVLCLMYMYENVLALICYCGQFLGFKAAGLQFSVSEKMLFGAVSRRVTVVWKLSDVATELCCCSWEDLAVIKCDLAMSMIVHCVLMLNSDVFCVLTRAIEHTSHLCQWNWLIVIHNPTPRTSAWPHLIYHVDLEEGEYSENWFCATVLCTIIMVHKGTRSSYRSIDCIGLWSCLV